MANTRRKPSRGSRADAFLGTFAGLAAGVVGGGLLYSFAPVGWWGFGIAVAIGLVIGIVFDVTRRARAE